MVLSRRFALAGPTRRSQAGVSLIEVLLGSLLFLAIALATVPMFTRSMVSNSSGNDSTRAANFGRERVEEMIQLPFTHPDLIVDTGNEKVTEEYYSLADDIWRDGLAPTDDPGDWNRTTTIRQYNVDALEDDVIQITEALAGGTDPSFVHLKEIEVSVSQLGGFLQNSTKTITLRKIRSQ